MMQHGIGEVQIKLWNSTIEMVVWKLLGVWFYVVVFEKNIINYS